MVKRSRITTGIAASGLVFGSLIAIGAAPVAQASALCDDGIAPVLHALNLSKKNVDVRHKSATITFSTHWSDDSSGVARASVSATSPTLKGQTRGASATLKRTAGDAGNGTWTGKMTIPKFTNDGKWTLSVQASDKKGNSKYYFTTDLVTGGFPSSFMVKSNPDLIKPKVRGLNFSPKTVDSRHGTKHVAVAAKVTDKGGSGVNSVFVSFGRSVPNKGNYGTYAVLSRVGKTDKFTGKATVTKYEDRDSKTTWNASLSTGDGIGNYVSMDSAAIGHKHWPNKLRVKNKGDKNAPLLKDWNFAPKSVSTANRAATVKLSARITDDRSGATSASASFSGPYSLYGYLGPTHKKGVFKGKGTLAACATGGTYTVYEVRVYDATGNYRTYNTAALQNRHFPTKLDVTGP